MRIVLRSKIIVLLSFLFIFIVGCASPTFILKDNNNGIVKNIEVGQTFNVELQAKPGTGFSWFFESNNHLKKIGKSEFISQKEMKLGGIELQIYKFEAIKKGKTELILNYKRSWEDEEPVKFYKITLNIQ